MFYGCYCCFWISFLGFYEVMNVVLWMMKIKKYKEDDEEKEKISFLDF